MSFQTGQKVICVDDHYRSFCRYPLKKRSIYTILGFYKCVCGSAQIILSEFPGVTNMGCRCHRTSIRRQSYYNWRFVSLEYSEMLKEFSEEKVEVLEEKKIQKVELQKEIV